ncbi:unnamed protein product [Rotaria sp. Silwood2]|nr:unnamed protein product [Rotaria sp. Silwood2]CAF3141815.1 unnamed protein product [Rotaria sp. Silwood2]CAF3450139.1 unnamed protein product [Rotaria sp. Silwood2]CAF4488154.1 unnamed protein product [Rotaria sp. Silwood2]CAF4531727.1 unnamed protein product [Rotaria sp. Silwood2]
MAPFITYLSSVQQLLTRYAMTTYTTLGNIGNILTIAVFCQSGQLKSSCSLYLLFMTICNFICLNFGTIPNIYTLDHIDIASQYLWACRIQFYIRHAFYQMMRTYKVLACIDRYASCSMNSHIRSFSRRKMAIYIIIGSAVCWLLITIFFSWMRTIENGSCNIFDNVYSMIYAVYHMISAGIIPPSLIAIFTVLVIRNLKQVRTRVQPNGRHTENIKSTSFLRKRDRDLIKMIFAEVIFYVLNTMPFSIYLIYRLIARSLIKSQEQKQIESFITYMLQSFILYFDTAVPFYIYILISSSFRTQLKRVLIKFYAFITRKRIRDGNNDNN